MAIQCLGPTCLYYPLKIVFLDDNRAFLDVLELEFGGQLNMSTGTDPNVILDIISDQKQDNLKTIYKLVNDVNVDTTIDRVIGFDISSISKVIYDKSRFENIAILVVDFEMPNINGLQFCEKIKDKNIFKVMLTVEADKDTVIKAFNDSLIDKFILKTNVDLFSDIKVMITELTYRFFNEKSQTLINEHTCNMKDLFSNQSYQNLLNEVLRTTKAVEFYIVDTSGSILFLDKDAHPTWLIIRHEEDFIKQLELLQGYDIPKSVMASVQRKEKTLFMLSEKEYKKPINEWLKYFYDLKKLDNGYYYSVVKDHITDLIEWDKVVSYSSYTNQNYE